MGNKHINTRGLHGLAMMSVGNLDLDLGRLSRALASSLVTAYKDETYEYSGLFTAE